MNTTSTPRRIESRDFYRRPGQQNTSSEKAKRNLDFSNPGTLPFFTNTTSVNIATAFAHARITSDTINKRPAHLKGTPMSPSQISKMNLHAHAHHPDDGFRTHFESSTASRPHGTLPIRDITKKTAANPRPAFLDYQDMDIDPPLFRDYQTHTTSAQLSGIIREREWAHAQPKVPGWFRKQQDQRNQNLVDVSPPKVMAETPPIVFAQSGYDADFAARAPEVYGDDLIDLSTPNPAFPLANKNPNGARQRFGEPVASFRRAAAASSSLLRGRNEGEWEYASNNKETELGSYRNAGSGNTGTIGNSYLDSRGVQNGIGSTHAPRRLNGGRTSAYESHHEYGVAGSLYGQTKGLSAGLDAGKENKDDEAVEMRDRNISSLAQRPSSRYSLRSHVAAPRRLSYDRDFNIREGHNDENVRDDHTETARKAAPAPTPYTARIKGPGAFPATAQRFSQRKNSAQEAEDDGIITPTVGRKAAARTASGQAAMTSGDLLSNHRYLRHGSGSHRGWGEYVAHQTDDDRASMHSFSDSFISNSTAGGGGLGNGPGLERDSPTLLKRLFRNIAAGWTGSAGSFAERISFIFFMVYFLIKETAVVVGAFVYRLLYSLLLGPVYSGVRETILLPASLWRVLTPGRLHDNGQSMTGILTGLTVVALSIVISQYSQSLFGTAGLVPRSLFGTHWLLGTSHKKTPIATMNPLTDQEIERLGGHGSVVVNRLVGVEQTLRQLYGLLDTLKSQNEEDSAEVRDTLIRLQQERQSFVDSNRGDQQRIDNLEREYVSLKRDLKASQAKNSELSKDSKEIDRIKKHVEKLAKSGGSRWGRSGATTEEVRRMIKDAIKAQEKDISDMLKPAWLTSNGDAAYTHVSRMIEDALNRYANDRFGKPDFALFSAGARIVPALTSPTFEPSARGIAQRLWRKMGMVSSQPPSAILDPSAHVGECWPMRGSSGQVAIHLSQPIDVSDFAIEHVAKSVAINWRSAPRQIEIWGYVIGDASDSDESSPSSDAITSQSSSHGSDAGQDTAAAEIANPPFADSRTKHGVGRLTRLASYEYEPSDTSAVQIVAPETRNSGPLRVRTIILKINSNWGHPEHTCIYRFRVHGHPAA